MCDTLAALGLATADGAVLFGKNSDREYTEAQHLQLVPAARHKAGSRVRLTYIEIDQVPETHEILISKPHWIWGAEIGANSHGLTIGNEAIFSKVEASMAPGIIGMDYVRLALERARDVPEGIHVITGLLGRYGQSGDCGLKRHIAYHNSFLLSDPRGAAIIEAVDREWVIRRVTNHYVISNAMTIEEGFDAASHGAIVRAMELGLHRGMVPFSFKGAYEDPAKVQSGMYRHGRASAMVADQAGRLRITDIVGILAEQQEGPPVNGRRPRICAHTEENPLGQTTGSWAAHLTAHKRIHWVTGTAAPCTGLFKPVMIETGLPPHGPMPGAEADGVSLWWRHEQLRRALDGASASDREEFFHGRNSLERRFLDAMQACPSVIDESTRRDATRIVNQCWEDGLKFESRWRERILRE